MNRFCDRTFLRLALIGALTASLGLAACGRKGPLDPPPAASVAGEPQASAPASAPQGVPSPTISPFGGQTGNQNPQTQTANAPKKRIFLDRLLD